MSMESGARIVRAAKNTGYTKVNNAAIADDRLSWEAAGLLAYLLTKPDNWVVRQGHLIAMRKGARERMMRMFRELREAGYLHLHREQGEGGRLSGSYYVLFEEADEPDPSLSDSPVPRQSVFPTVGKPDPLVITDGLATTDSKHRKVPSEPGGPTGRAAARVPLEELRAMVDPFLKLTGENPKLRWAVHARAARQLWLAGYRWPDIERTYRYIRSQADYLAGQPVTMATVQKYIHLAVRQAEPSVAPTHQGVNF